MKFISLLQACSVKKKKKVGLIPVQATARSRRMYKLRGSRTAVQGRPRLAHRLAVQMAVGDTEDTDGGILRHKLPGRKQRNHAGGEHRLAAAISANRRASKKH